MLINNKDFEAYYKVNGFIEIFSKQANTNLYHGFAFGLIVGFTIGALITLAVII